MMIVVPKEKEMHWINFGNTR